MGVIKQEIPSPKPRSDYTSSVDCNTQPYTHRYDVARCETMPHPGGTTEHYRPGIPIILVDDPYRTRLDNPQPFWLTKILKGRKVRRGRITTLENTPANPKRNPSQHGNGTV